MVTPNRTPHPTPSTAVTRRLEGHYGHHRANKPEQHAVISGATDARMVGRARHSDTCPAGSIRKLRRRVLLLGVENNASRGVYAPTSQISECSRVAFWFCHQMALLSAHLGGTSLA